MTTTGETIINIDWLLMQDTSVDYLNPPIGDDKFDTTVQTFIFSLLLMIVQAVILTGAALTDTTLKYRP